MAVPGNIKLGWSLCWALAYFYKPQLFKVNSTDCSNLYYTDCKNSTHWLPVADLGGGDGGDASPPTSLKVTFLAKKSALILNNSAPFRDASPPTDLNVTNPAEKSVSFFFFFLETTWFWAKKTFEYQISAEKSVTILVKTSEFLRFWLQIPPHQNFLDPPLLITISSRLVTISNYSHTKCQKLFLFLLCSNTVLFSNKILCFQRICSLLYKQVCFSDA